MVSGTIVWQRSGSNSRISSSFAHPLERSWLSSSSVLLDPAAGKLVGIFLRIPSADGELNWDLPMLWWFIKMMHATTCYGNLWQSCARRSKPWSQRGEAQNALPLLWEALLHHREHLCLNLTIDKRHIFAMTDSSTIRLAMRSFMANNIASQLAEEADVPMSKEYI